MNRVSYPPGHRITIWDDLKRVAKVVGIVVVCVLAVGYIVPPVGLFGVIVLAFPGGLVAPPIAESGRTLGREFLDLLIMVSVDVVFYTLIVRMWRLAAGGARQA